MTFRGGTWVSDRSFSCDPASRLDWRDQWIALGIDQDHSGATFDDGQDFVEVVRIDANGGSTSVTNAEMGLAPDQRAELGPVSAGIVWATYGSGWDPQFGLHDFEGLLAWDGEAWTRVPYQPEGDRSDRVIESSGRGSARAQTLAVGPGGTVWMVLEIRGADDVVARWDGTRWQTFVIPDLVDGRPARDVPPRPAALLLSDPTLRDADPPTAWTEGFSPDGDLWVANRNLYLVIPEAVAASD